MFLIIKYVVLVKEQSLEPALYTLPFLYGVTIIVNVFSVLYGGLSSKFDFNSSLLAHNLCRFERYGYVFCSFQHP